MISGEFFLLRKFLLDRGPVCGATGTLCFGLGMILPTSFKSQGGSVITCTLLSLACNDPQSHLWLPGPGIEPELLAPEASMIPLWQPDNSGEFYYEPSTYKYTARTAEPIRDVQYKYISYFVH